jgi:hypothetical protein
MPCDLALNCAAVHGHHHRAPRAQIMLIVPPAPPAMSSLSKIAVCSGFVGAILLLVTVLIVLTCQHDPHAMVPLHCTVKHRWFMLYCAGENSVMISFSSQGGMVWNRILHS